MEVYTNTHEYDPNEYKSHYISENVSKEVFNFNTLTPGIALYELHKNFVQHDDNFVASFGETNEQFYEVKMFRTQNGFTPGTQFSVVVEVNTASISHHRAIYSFWDFLGDVGGLNDSLAIFG